MKLKTLFRYFYRKLLGEYRWGIKNGLVAGNGVSFMGGVNLGSEPYLITLGNNVRVAGDVRFVTHDGGTWTFRRELANETVVKYGKITVGDDCFIGLRSIILPGVTIGKKCVIGAGSVVTHDVPDGMVVAGVPARVICTLDEYIQKCRDSMPEGFDEEKYRQNKKEHLLSLYGE